MTNEDLIQELVSGGYLKTPAIVDAFRAIDRKDFVPKESEKEAYGNYPLSIGFGQTISQPLTVAFMLELLEPQPGEKILDIGSGSGWQTALLASIVGKQRNQKSPSAPTRLPARQGLRRAGNLKNQNEGKVIAVERIPELKTMSESNISKYSFVQKGVVKTILGDGSRGYPDDAPFDKIIAAASGEKLSSVWNAQLKTGGRIVAPIQDSVFVFDKISDNEFRQKEYFGFGFVPLVKD